MLSGFELYSRWVPLSRIFGTFVVKFLACLPLLRFSNIYDWYDCPFLTDFYPKKVT